MRRNRWLDPTSLQSHSGQVLMPVDTVLERLKVRTKAYENFDIDKVSELGIKWHDQDADHRESGYYARINNRDLMLSRQAMKSASSLVKVSDVRYWNQFPDRNAFPTTLSHILEHAAMNGTRMNAKRLLIRHDGLKVRSIQPFTYKIKDAYDLLSDFVTMITETVGPIQGISSIEEGDPGDICSYRVVLDTNIIPMLEKDLGQHMMFLLAVSETGAYVMPGASAATALGLYRTTCLNSSIREQLVTKWNHRSKGLDRFYEDSGERIQQIGYYQDQFASVFADLVNARLGEVSPREMLNAFHHEKLITSGHFDAAELYIDTQTEDGRPVETQYDMFNVLTLAAQDLPTLAQRHAAETRMMHLFTEKGGIFQRMREAAEERAKSVALRRGAPLASQEDTTYTE